MRPVHEGRRGIRLVYGCVSERAAVCVSNIHKAFCDVYVYVTDESYLIPCVQIQVPSADVKTSFREQAAQAWPSRLRVANAVH